MQAKNMLAKVAVIMSLCAFCGSVFAAPTSKTLTKNEELYPQGWSVGEQVKFKKGTTVSLNEKGAVVNGVLASDTYLRPQGWQRVINDYSLEAAYAASSFFSPHWIHGGTIYNMAVPSYGHIRYQDGTAVTFSEQGTVISGTIAEEATVGIGEGQYGFVVFKKDSELHFYDSGAVKTGTLSEDTKLHPVGWQNNAIDRSNAGFAEFKAKSVINLTVTGEVMSGTLKKALQWKNEGQEIELPVNKVSNFTEQGAAVTE
ncbi:MAG: hypothetical protein GX084_05095 [Acholeplasmataceae bacterium]|nr:hypothetical protein [Acidaminococcaceae bacterium]NLY83973.1 hypothetical protein [Acholeplasmataceae bacterium]